MNEQHTAPPGRGRRTVRLAILALTGAGLLLTGILIGNGTMGTAGGPALAQAHVGPDRVHFTPADLQGGPGECPHGADADVLKDVDPAFWTQGVPLGVTRAVPTNAAEGAHIEVSGAATAGVAVERVALATVGPAGAADFVVVGCGASVEEARAELERALDKAVAEGRLSPDQAQRLRTDLAVSPVAIGRMDSLDGPGPRRVIVLAERESHPK